MAKNTTAVAQNVTDISLDSIRKKRFRIDGDDTRVLELNTSDLNILARLKEAYPKLVELANNAFHNLPEIDSSGDNYDFMTDEATSEVITKLETADKDMRQLVDYIFNSNVSELCAPDGSMYDPINGKFRFEHIIDTLAALYETDVSGEMNKLANRVKKHTDKYTRR